MSEKKEAIMQELRLLKKLLFVLALLIAGYIALVLYEIKSAGVVVEEQVVGICRVHVSNISALAIMNSKGAFGLLVGNDGHIML